MKAWLKMKKIKLYGVAGAGKTTKCLNLIQKFIKEGYNIEDITFTTYTRAGIHSIKQKLEENSIFIPEQNNFKTLHSLCWKLSGFQTPMYWKTFCDDKGLEYGRDEFATEKTIGQYIEDAYEKIQNLYSKNITKLTAKQLDIKIKEIYQTDENITESITEDIITGLLWAIEWKESKKQYAYSDALINVLEEGKSLDTKILIVDEAQDLFPTQIRIIEKWIKQKNIDVFVLAGDDDQCVHEWAGSDPKFIIETKCDEEIILDHSYRCPKKVCEFANKILGEIEYRKEKWINSTKEEGVIALLQYPSFNELIKKINLKEKTFFLFRTNKLKNGFAEFLFKRTNIPYGFIGDKEQSPYTFKYVNTHNAIIKLERGENINWDELSYLIDFIKSEQRHWGIKTKIKKEAEYNNFYSREYFIKNVVKWALKVYEPGFDLKNNILDNCEYTRVSGKNQDKKISKNEIVIEKIRESDKLVQFKTVFSDKGRKYAMLPLNLGTFHASKGLEAESVTVFLGTCAYFSEINDTEWRCLYVATTRTRNKLTFVNSNFFNEDYALYDAFSTIWN